MGIRSLKEESAVSKFYLTIHRINPIYGITNECHWPNMSIFSMEKRGGVGRESGNGVDKMIQRKSNKSYIFPFIFSFYHLMFIQMY